MRFLQFIAVTSLTLMCVLAPAHAEKRVALVVGNGAYLHADKLTNPVNDARSVRDVLKQIGFDVTYGENLDQKSLRRTVGDFARAVSGAAVAVVYFAGHGATFGDTSYVVPIDAEFSSLEQVPYDLVPVEMLIGELRRVDGVRIAILDACRDNAAERELKKQGTRGGEVSRGLAPMKNPDGLILAYATQYLSTAADGSGANSPFTAALLHNIATPGLDVKDLFFKVGQEVVTATGRKQRPEISISMYEPYALVPATKPEALPAAPAAPVKPADGLQTAAVAPPVVPAAPAAGCGAVAVTISWSARSPQPLSRPEECALKPKDVFKECEKCPDMVVVPAGTFMMGSPVTEEGRFAHEGPRTPVTFASVFAVGKFAVTFDEWDTCVAGGGCSRAADDGRPRGRNPVVNVSWDDAQAYVAWLTKMTGKPYRLLSEAEREYVTRAGTTTPFWWGASISTRQANYDGTAKPYGGEKGIFRQAAQRVDQFAANPFGLYQVHGNVSEWVIDCWRNAYLGMATNGAAWTTSDCGRHVVRGGSWFDAPQLLRSAARSGFYPAYRSNKIGLRIARPL